MEENLKLIRKFYDAFAKKDVEGMLACYAPNVAFEDPAFGPLNSEDARLMWRMLLSRGGDLKITYSNEWADNQTGGVDWEALYEFGSKKRKVHNKIKARFTFNQGHIISHTDSFSFWRWSSMALGLPGLLLGWSPVIMNKVRQQVLKKLKEFKAQQKSSD